MAYQWGTVHPDETRTLYVIMCSNDATNDGTASDSGELQGRTVSSATVAEIGTSDLTLGAVTSPAVTIQGVSYAINTVLKFDVSGGSDGKEYFLKFAVTPSSGNAIYVEKTVHFSRW